MAAHKKKKKQLTEALPASTVKQTKNMMVSKLSDAKSELVCSASSELANYEVVTQADGLLDLSNTPKLLLDIARRNAAESPLLRIPPEIRNKIWSYVMNGNTVYIRTIWKNILARTEERYRSLVCRGHAVNCTGHIKPYRRVPRDTHKMSANMHKISAAFHLSEVCRQVYSETATLGYPGTIFFFEAEDEKHEFELVKKRSASLVPAHRNSVRDISFGDVSMTTYLVIPDYSFRKIFPGLERIHVHEHEYCLYDLDDLEFWVNSKYRIIESGAWTKEQMKKLWRKLVLIREGDGVELLFYDIPDMTD